MNTGMVSDYPHNFFDDFISHRLQIDSGSLPPDYATDIWGVDFREKSTEGVITKVCTNRRTGKPKFEVYVEETKETYTQRYWI